jgi:hypothetical protein
MLSALAFTGCMALVHDFVQRRRIGDPSAATPLGKEYRNEIPSNSRFRDLHLSFVFFALPDAKRPLSEATGPS